MVARSWIAAAEGILKGQKLGEEVIRAASEEASRLADPNPDARWSAEYKKDMGRVLVARGLRKALQRLGA